MSRVYKSKAKKRLTVFIDTETENGFIGESIACTWCYVFGDDKENSPQITEGYDCIEMAMNQIKQKFIDLNADTVTLYAHNATFDLMRFKTQLPYSEFKAQLVCGQLIAGKLVYDGIEYECRDSLRLLPQSLASLAKSLAPNLPKLQINHLIGYEIGNVDDMEYAKRDVETLRAILLSFAMLADIKFEKLKFSAAGQAFASFKEMYQKDENLKYQAIKQEFNKMILKNYYYGGRIYIRHNHNPLELSNCVSLDITSSYPSQMLNQYFPQPGKNPRYTKYIPSEKGRYFLKVRTSNYDANIPILPHRKFNEKDEVISTVYPHGDFDSYITDIEYEYIKKHQKEQLIKIEIISCIFWSIKDCSQWLKPYIQRFYKLKEQGDNLNKQEKNSGDGLRTVAKLFLNALYGKFAQKYIENGGESVSWGGGDELEVFGQSSSDHRNAHISAFITGGARTQLYEAIAHYGWNNVVYCDTDSVKVYEDVYNNTPKMVNEGDYLGSWKPEGIYKDLQVIAPKVYIGKHCEKGKEELEIKAKGLPMRGITAIEYGDIFEKINRSKTDDKQNDKQDDYCKSLICEAAKTLKPIFVYYGYKPVKLKTFIRTLKYAQETAKQMSYPESVNGMVFNGNVYKIPIIQHEMN